MVSKLRGSIEILELSSPSVTTTQVSTSSSFIPKTFSNAVSFKLDEENFLSWRHQAFATIKAHNLQNHLKKEKMPKRYKSEADKESEIQSKEFLNWEQ